MTFYDMQQQNPWQQPNAWQQQNPWQQMGQSSPQFAYGQWPGNPLAAFGQQPGPAWGQWGQQHRQLSPYDVNEVVRQLLPALPQVIAQAQQSYPGTGGIGYAAYGSAPRTLTPQDVNEVVRQLMPALPQIVGALQGQPLQQFAMHGGHGGQGHLGQNFSAQNPFMGAFQQPWQFGQPGQQYGLPQFQSAFGVPQQGGLGGQGQRHLTQHDVAEVTRQLAGLIPQVIGNLQSFNQQRTM